MTEAQEKNAARSETKSPSSGNKQSEHRASNKLRKKKAHRRNLRRSNTNG